MHLLQAECDVHYVGRGETFLERGTRLIVIKDDGSVIIHQDKGIKPLNYMGKSSLIDTEENPDGTSTLHIASKTETIDVIIYNLLFETFLDFGENLDLVRRGTEKQIQAWLAEEENFQKTFGSGLRFIAREYQTTKGACDLIAFNKETKQLVLIEVKRNAKRSDAYQLVRYKTAMKELYESATATNSPEIVSSFSGNVVPLPTEICCDVECILAAPRFKAGVEEEANARNIECVKIPFPA